MPGLLFQFLVFMQAKLSSCWLQRHINLTDTNLVYIRKHLSIFLKMLNHSLNNTPASLKSAETPKAFGAEIATCVCLNIKVSIKIFS